MCRASFCCSSVTGWCDSLAASLVSLLPEDPDPSVESDWPCRRYSYWCCTASHGVIGEFCFDVSVWPIKRWTAPASAGYSLPSTSRTPGTFVFSCPLVFTFPRSLVCFVFPPKFWVGFSEFSFSQILGNCLFDSGRGSIAGLAWKLTTKIQVLSPPHYKN